MRAGLLRGPAGALAERLTGRRILHCFGDSHAVVFKNMVKQSTLERTWIDFVIVQGATAFGLANPNSRTNAFGAFSSVVARLPVRRSLLFMLGEVDCGFLVWHRAQEMGVRVDGQFELSVRNYTEFLEGLLAQGRRSLLVAAVPPPTIGVGKTSGEVANARRGVTASLSDRTAMTLRYNSRLSEWSKQNGCVFLDYTNSMIDPATGVIRDEYRHPDPLNHHAHPDRFRELMAGRLRDAGFD
jgi:hypothetical protein